MWALAAEDRRLVGPAPLAKLARVVSRGASRPGRICPRPTSLRHDAAEAVRVGLRAVLGAGWPEARPDVLRGS